MPKFSKKRYESYINSREWKRKRLQVLERDDNTCQTCGGKRKLHVHHLTYARLGSESLDDLITLCEECHQAHHELVKKQKRKHKKDDTYVSYQTNKETLQKKGTEAAIEEQAWFGLADPRLLPEKKKVIKGKREKKEEKLTEEEIMAKRTPAGAWTKKQLAEWGVPWPPPKGWKKRLKW